MTSNNADPSIKLSAVVPIGGFPNGDSVLRSWATSNLPQGLEVILVLDSDDETVRRTVFDVAGLNSNINVLTSQHRNPGSTREIGLNAATGEWICFWDADDLPNIDNIWRAIENMENKGIDIIVGNYHSVNFESKHVADCLHGKDDPLMTVYINPGLWRFVFKREIIENITFPALRMGEDQTFLFRSISKARRIRFVEDYFYNYIQYSSGQLTKSKKILTDLIKARDLCKEIYTSDKSNYILSAIIKQDLTLIKRAKFSIKFVTIIDLVKMCSQSVNNLKTFFQVLVAARYGR